MNMLVAGMHFDALDGPTGAALMAAAQKDVLQLGTALLRAARAGDDADLDQTRHALSGLCRMMGTEALDMAVNRPLKTEADFALFELCLEGTLGTLRHMQQAMKERESNG